MLMPYLKDKARLMTSLDLPVFSSLDIATIPTQLDTMLTRHLDTITHLLDHQTTFTWETLLRPLHEMDNELERFWSPFSHLHSVKSTKALRKAYEACLPLLSAYSAAIGQNERLFAAMQALDRSSLTPVQSKLLDDHLRDFKLSGVALDPEQKKRFEALCTRLSALSNQFENHVLDATHAYELHVTEAHRLQGLPEHTLAHARELAEASQREGWVLNLEFPCYWAVITYADDRALRETMHHAYATRASNLGPHAGQFDNTEVMHEILALRHEQAQCLGYPHYADLSLATKMAPSTERVNTFLSDLCRCAHAQAVAEFQTLQAYALSAKLMDQLEPWDIAYVSEKQKEARYALSEETLRAYFPLQRVLEGLFTFLTKLYGMHVEPVHDVDVWHPDVTCYRVMDEHHVTRGYVYLDLFARKNKRGGAWMDGLQRRYRRDDGTLQLPIATLTCNFAKANQPPTLSHDEVLTLFHEFGHGLQHILTQVDEWDASGINGVEWDAVELPSQFFENWCWQEASLPFISAHVDTHEPLPPTLMQALRAAKNYQSAMSLMRHLSFALFDFHLHQTTPTPDLIEQTLKQIRSQTAVIPIAPYLKFEHSFSHIFAGGYAAGYYSYLWADVLASDAFARFEEEGLFNPQTGRDFLNHILETGGSHKALEAYVHFRQRMPTLEALLRQHGIQTNEILKPL